MQSQERAEEGGDPSLWELLEGRREGRGRALVPGEAGSYEEVSNIERLGDKSGLGEKI